MKDEFDKAIFAHKTAKRSLSHDNREGKFLYRDSPSLLFVGGPTQSELLAILFRHF